MAKVIKKILKVISITIITVILSIVLLVFGVIGAVWFFVDNTNELTSEHFYAGDAVFLSENEKGDYWTVGFSKMVITPKDVLENPESYYIAGYYGPIHPKEIFDDMWVRAIYLDDNTGRGGALFAVLDVVGLSNKEVLSIREMISDFADENNIKSVNVMTTHNHAGIDTQGLWGEPFKLKSGNNSSYNEFIREKTVESMKDAYDNRENGRLFWGDITPEEDAFNDNRPPYVYDKSITGIRFEPFDNTLAHLYIVTLGCHPENMAAGNASISADWPYYMGEYIKEANGADYIFINGAIGVLINAYGLQEVFDGERNNKEFTVAYGEMIGQYVLDIDYSEEIIPILNISISRILLPVENYFLIVAGKLKLLNINYVKNPGRESRYAIYTEVGFMQFGKSINVVMAPGELAPEFALGGFLSAEDAANGYDMDVTPIFETLGEGKNLVFGLFNDQIGYIIPDNDFYLHKLLPYISWAKGPDGRDHYEETVSTGPDTGRVILKEWEKLITEKRG